LYKRDLSTLLYHDEVCGEGTNVSDALPTTAMFVFIGLIIIGTGVPLALQKVPPNRLYGLRVKATFRDPAVWYEANRRTGWDLIWMGMAIAAVALALPIAGFTEDAQALWTTGILLVLSLRMAIGGWRYANRLLRLAESEQSKRHGERAN